MTVDELQALAVEVPEPAAQLSALQACGADLLTSPPSTTTTATAPPQA
jgi:hypothetical protein